jgi:hypothetical protein
MYKYRIVEGRNIYNASNAQSLGELNKAYTSLYNEIIDYAIRSIAWNDESLKNGCKKITHSHALKHALKYKRDYIKNSIDNEQHKLLIELLKTVKFEFCKRIKEQYVMVPLVDKDSIMYGRALTSGALEIQSHGGMYSVPLHVVAENIYYSMYYHEHKPDVIIGD